MPHPQNLHPRRAELPRSAGIKQRREQRHEERRAAGACFNCGDIGYLSRDCPNNL
ncbi:hypothetical protein EHS14_04360, partial [Schaalia georgiae]